MAIEDSDPERRNLTVMSGAFIIYYLAGGSFDERQITLEVVNMQFSRPNVLALIAWIMLLWFIYRYWHTHKGLFTATFMQEFSQRVASKALLGYIKSRIKSVPEGQRLEVNPSRLIWRDRKLGVFYRTSHYIELDNESRQHLETKEDNFMWLNGIDGKRIAVTSFITTSIVEPSFANYVIPYLLAVLAMLLGVASFISKLSCN